MFEEVIDRRSGGRKPLSPEGVSRDHSQGIYWTSNELMSVKELAESKGLSQAETIRQAVLREYAEFAGKS